jgi:type I restriction enzyme S subunit
MVKTTGVISDLTADSTEMLRQLLVSEMLGEVKKERESNGEELEFIKLSLIASIDKGKTPIKSSKRGQYPLVTTAEIHTTTDHFDFDSESVLIPLVSSTGHGHASIKRLHYASGKFSVGTILACVTPNNIEGYDARFIYEYLSAFKEELIVSKMTGTANVTLTLSDIKEIMIPKITKEEQKRLIEGSAQIDSLVEATRIVDNYENILFRFTKERLFKDLTDNSLSDIHLNVQFLISHLDKFSLDVNKLDQLKLLVVKLLMSGNSLLNKGTNNVATSKNSSVFSLEELPFQIPDNWKWVHLSEIGKIVGGGTPSTDNPSYFSPIASGIPWVTPADMKSGQISNVSHGRRSLTKEGLSNSGATLIPKGSVLFTSRAPIGNVGIALNDISTNQGFKSLIPADITMNRFIAYYLYAISDWLNEISSGTTFKEISGKKMSNLPFPLPDKKVQDEIVQKVEVTWKILDDLKDASDSLVHYRNRVISAISQRCMPDIYESKVG